MTQLTSQCYNSLQINMQYSKKLKNKEGFSYSYIVFYCIDVLLWEAIGDV